MFAARSYVRSASVTQSIAGCIGYQRRRVTTTIREDLLQSKTPLAEQLAATNLWYYGRSKHALPPGQKRPKADKARVNIIDEKLCGKLSANQPPYLTKTL